MRNLIEIICHYSVRQGYGQTNYPLCIIYIYVYMYLYIYLYVYKEHIKHKCNGVYIGTENVTLCKRQTSRKWKHKGWYCTETSGQSAPAGMCRLRRVKSSGKGVVSERVRMKEKGGYGFI